MKQFFHFIKTTLLGGFLFLLPLIVVLILLQEVLKHLAKLVKPLGEWIAIKSVFGIQTPYLLAFFLLLLVGFLAGLIAKTRAGASLRDGLDHWLAAHIPGYVTTKKKTKGMMESSPASSNPSQTPLPSWKDGSAKRAIIDFVARVTEQGSRNFVPPEERIAVFDNDGTLWCEKPMPIQADFLFRKLALMAEKDPTLRARQPWKAVVEKDYAWLGGAITKHYQGDDSQLKMMAGGLLQAYEGSTIEEFEKVAGEFLQTAQHPTLKRPYRECAYQPMIELLHFLTAQGFTNYIASGGGRDFMRPITQELYGIPPNRVIGSSVELAYRDDGKIANVIHKADLDIFDDGPAKPVRIWSRIGRRPIFAAGNSNGDIPMLHFCAHPSRPCLSILLNHDDAEREFAYQGGAEESMTRARKEGWIVVSMKEDWLRVFNP